VSAPQHWVHWHGNAARSRLAETPFPGVHQDRNLAVRREAHQQVHMVKLPVALDVEVDKLGADVVARRA
jgi:hypothetical protein